jgi:hypothetical protein
LISFFVAPQWEYHLRMQGLKTTDPEMLKAPTIPATIVGTLILIGAIAHSRGILSHPKRASNELD